MTKRLRRLAAGIALTAIAATGYTLTDDPVVQPADTTWGAPDTTTPATTDDVTNATAVALRDTTWG